MILPRLAIATVVCPALASGGLIAHWKLDGSPADEVASFPAKWEGEAAFTAEVAAPASTAAANLASAWLGAGDGFDFDRDQPFSVTAWIKGVSQDSAVIGDMSDADEMRGWELHVGGVSYGAPAGSVSVFLANDYPSIAIQVDAAVDVLDGAWHHIGFSYDGSSTAAGVRIYVDGRPVAGMAAFDTLGATMANHDVAKLEIGTRGNGAAHHFTGALDEVAVFDHNLTPAEMAAIRTTGVESVTFPAIAATVPRHGQNVNMLTSAEVVFDFPVTGVDAGDLRVNGVPATGLEAADAKHYRFTFAAPPQGDVFFTWTASHGIAALSGTPAQPAGWHALFVPVLPPGQVIISEFLTKNAGGRKDEDHDTPDWIELHNPGTATVDLAGWSLTDDPSKPRAWVFPSRTLPPGARLVVFASNKNRRAEAGNLHANFKLSGDRGYLALADPSGSIVHVFDGYPEQEGNVSFGLPDTGKPSDGRAGWRYLKPTPGAQNAAPYSGAALSQPTFSPAMPQPGDAISVIIHTSPESMPAAPPVLTYRIMHGAEISIDFADDGLHADGAAGDLQWGAVIPAGATPGDMVRWRVTMTSNSVISRWPVNTSAILPLPLYEGTVIGGSSPGQALPVYQVFVPGYVFPVNTSQTGIDTSTGRRGAFYGNGVLYDNVLIRTKGTTSRNLFKRSHRVDFNPGRDFAWSQEFEPQREVNLNSEYNDPSYLRQNQQLWMHRDSGRSGAPHFPVKLLMNGVTWQLAFHTYSADSELVETMGLDPRGAIYKQVGQLNSSYGQKKSRRWETHADIAALATGISESASPANRSRYIFDNLNLPAVINYLAVARIAQEGDDVWANMVVYRDSEGTREWQPIPFDLNLSFGQLFYGFSSPYNTTIQATNDANKSHPLYGSSACLANTGNTGQYNRLYNAIIQNPITRVMLLRRIRTLTDRYLTASPQTSPLEAGFDAMGALIGPDADADRARWGWPPNAGAYGLGPNISPAKGLGTLKTSFLAPRRTHFYTTHSIDNASKVLGIGNNHKAGIPNAQVASPVVSFGTIEAHPANPAQEFIQLTNPGTEAVDLSGWTVRGASGSFKLKGGTVIPPLGSLHVSPDVVAFRARAVSPMGNESHFVVGPYSGRLSPYGETLRLENATAGLVAQAQVAPDPTAPPARPAITEILSSSAHTGTSINGDWWELTNTGTAALDLAGFSWDDSRDLAGQAIFPAVQLAAGESAIILDEGGASGAAAFRSAWGLSANVKILTRADFGLPDGFRGLGSADSIIVYLPDGTGIARADYTAHEAGKSRAWFRNGVAIPDGYSQIGKYAAAASAANPADIGSPGFSPEDPATFTEPYAIWAAARDLWSTLADPTADPDGDGRSNRAEYVFGGNPLANDTAPSPAIVATEGGLDWTFQRRSNDPGIVYKLESSRDLGTWVEFTPALVREVPHPALAHYVLATYRIVPEADLQFLRANANERKDVEP